MNSCTPIAHFERKYEIHPSGQVWNKGKETWQTQTQNPNGYMKVLLSMNGERKQLLVHQLVAKHFLPNPYGHVQVNHKDGDKTNNSLGNLEWVSSSDNIQHSLETGLRKGFMSLEEKRSLVNRVLVGKEKIRDLATEVGRQEESLSGMLRRMAEKDGRGEEWKNEMKRRRKRVAIRNLEKVNPGDPGRSQGLN